MSFRLSSRLLHRTRIVPTTSYAYGRTIFSPSIKNSPLWRFGSATVVIAGTTLFLVYYLDSRSAIHRYFFTPLLRHLVDAETSHKIAIKVLRSGLGPKDLGLDDGRLAIEVGVMIRLFVYVFIHSPNSYGEINYLIQLA